VNTFALEHWQSRRREICFSMMRTPKPSPALDWCLFLDVDGTLVEFADSPLETFVDDELKEVLRQVAERLGGAVALVSGRSLQYLDSLFAPLRLPAAGLHGVERRKASGAIHGASFVDTRLNGARMALAELVRAHAGTFLEDKGRTVAVHYRLAPQFESELRAALIATTKPLGSHYHIQEGNMVLEIKPRGFNKGSAVGAFLQEPPFSGRTPVFVGDDLTDEGGFRMVESHGGISIAVGDRVRAQQHLENPAAVRAWLRSIAALDDMHRE
jgi:trehalose 6-phosphate phosphatase